MTSSVHVGKSINYGPLVLYTHFDAANPANNVIDVTTPINVSCPSGACTVGMLPTTDGSVSRTVFIDGKTATASAVNVAIAALGVTIGTLVSVLAANTAPAAIDQSGATASAEYDTPASR